MPYASDDQLFPVWREPRSVWERTGLNRKQRRILDLSLFALLAVFTAGWLYTAVVTIEEGGAPMVVRRVGSGPSPLSAEAPPEATFALNALIEQLVDWDEIRGESGEVNVVFQAPGDTLRLPGTVPAEVDVGYAPVGSSASTSAASTAAGGNRPPVEPGIRNLVLRLSGAIRAVPNLSVVTLFPTSRMRDGSIGGYRIGNWPNETGAYAPPIGFVEVTPENLDTYVSTHFQLGDFITKGQDDVWPKYVVLSPRLLDKLELTLQELERQGHPVENVLVVSGFRTPWYNRAGGNTQGRGSLSRHMYGDASDIAIDNDGDGCMDDLTGDGRATVADARVIAAAADKVEQQYPHLVGGIGIYAPTGGHCGMVHIDTRGHRARW